MSLESMNQWSEMLSLRRSAFRDSSALYEYSFDRDHGAVAQIGNARKYADRWEEMRERGLGLLFWGLPGNGKTFAAACIANALLEKWVQVRMTTLGQVLNALPAMSGEEKLRYLNDLRDCDLLILDDFGMERRSDYAREQIFSLVDSRYLSRKPMIVTTNLSLTELKNPADMMQQRIFDRILEMCVPVCFDGGSLRQEKARENIRLYRQLIS